VVRRHPDLLQQQLNQAVSRLGADVAEKLRGREGQPEAQLRAPFDRLLREVAATVGLPPLVPVDESPLPNGARPDYAAAVWPHRPGQHRRAGDQPAPPAGRRPRHPDLHRRRAGARLLRLGPAGCAPPPGGQGGRAGGWQPPAGPDSRRSWRSARTAGSASRPTGPTTPPGPPASSHTNDGGLARQGEGQGHHSTPEGSGRATDPSPFTR
jgi:hypothetical protein